MEEWRDVIGFEGRYAVSHLGNVKILKSQHKSRIGTLLVPQINRAGYAALLLGGSRYGRTILVHKIVMEAFIGKRSEGMDINHINFDRADNRLENLEYVSRRDNLTHSRERHLKGVREWHKNYIRPVGDEHWTRKRNELVLRGSKHGRATITEDQVREIRQAIKDGAKPLPLARQYGTTVANIENIKYGKTWKHLL